MSYSPSLSSGFTNGKNRSQYISPQSGMCSFCTSDCIGSCEIGQAAVLGAQTIYPMTTGDNQIASEKDYPIDYSHFNINGRVFGAIGAEETYEDANIFKVNTSYEYGSKNKIKMTMPIILPALVKLNWEDYFAGAAMAGVTCIIGEDAKSKDECLKIEEGKIIDFPFLGQILESFNKYYRGYGQIVVQCNVEDDLMGVAEIAIKKYKAEAIEIKFGQGAKGTQPVNRLKDYEMALEKKHMGYLVYPNPDTEAMKKAVSEGVAPNFYMYGRLPLWNEETLAKRIEVLRNLGAKNIYFKMAGYDVKDIRRLLSIATELKIDMVTFDGAGGGSGYSPSKMMNEWSLPTVCLEKEVTTIMKELKKVNTYIPSIVMTGGFVSEDQVFKGIAFGDRYINAIGLCRSAMAAAMSGKKIGRLIKDGKTPKEYLNYGSTVEEIFGELPDLRAIYGKEANDFSTGAIGVFSYLNKINFGLKHFAALNRKFDLKYLDRTDLIPLTQEIKNMY